MCFKINILYVVIENAAEERPELARDIDVASCNITATPSIGAVSWMRGAWATSSMFSLAIAFGLLRRPGSIGSTSTTLSFAFATKFLEYLTKLR